MCGLGPKFGLGWGKRIQQYERIGSRSLSLRETYTHCQPLASFLISGQICVPRKSFHSLSNAQGSSNPLSLTHPDV